jgi:tetratricopeptide (TPR) repeat protein
MSQVTNDVSYYDLLGVAPDASMVEIRSAYRALVARFHPDVNPVENAEELTVLLNTAWETLRDPELRKAYDESIGYTGEVAVEEPPAGVDAATAPAGGSTGTSTTASQETSAAAEGATAERADAPPAAPVQETLEVPRCERCGMESPSLSAAAFTYVLSALIPSFRKSIAGLMCDPCRSKAAGLCALRTVLFGWWAPLGPFYSFQSLYTAAIGGKRDPAANAVLKRRMGLAYRERGDLNEALTCLEASAVFAQGIDDSMSEDLRDLHERGAKRIPMRTVLPGQLLAGPLTLAFFCGMALVVAAILQVTASPTTLQRCQQLNADSHFREALPVCNQAVQETRDPGAFLGRGVARVALGENQQSLSDLSRVLAVDPTNALALASRCRAYVGLSQPALALNDCNAAILTDPSNAPAFAWRCLARGGLGEAHAGLSDCNQAIKLAPHDTSLLANRCLAYNAVGDFADALDDCNAAIAANGQDPVSYQSRCFTYLGLEDARSAQDDCGTAIALDDQLPYAYWGLGKARASLQDPRSEMDLKRAAYLFQKQGDTKNARKVEQSLAKHVPAKRVQKHP